MIRAATETARVSYRTLIAWQHVIALILLVSLLVHVESAQAATNVSGTISANTTWTLANSPYVMTGDVTVASGVTLTIEAGVVVQGDASTRKLTVNGSLSAVGTSGSPITFTSTTDTGPGQWYQLQFAGSGSSTLKYVNVRNGGSNFADTMVYVTGGSVTIDDSDISFSSNVGVKSFSSSGADATITMHRTKVHDNGSHGIHIFNAHADIIDSASWSNGGDGIKVWVSSGTQATSTTITGTSIWNNIGTGVQISQDSGVEALGPDGSNNAIYDNGTFGFTTSETWNQLTAARTSLAMDWRSNYWGPVSFVACGFGAGNGHLSFGAPDPDASALFPIPRGPTSRDLATQVQGLDIFWCGNDKVTDNAPLYAQPDLQFDAPPPTFGGLLVDGTWGGTQCDCDDPWNANSGDNQGGTSHTYSHEPVSTASGSLTEHADDLHLAGPGIPFSWSRNYNSADTAVTSLGPGWTHPFAAKVTLANPTTGELEYRSGSGQRTHFTKVTGGSSGAATYRARGFDGSMKRLSDNSYQLVTRDQRTFSFDSSGNLTQLKPRFGPATTLTYTSGKLSSIVDSAGRTISITYTVADPTLIEKVTLPDGRYVQYGYTSGRLTSVRDARGKTSAITYDGNGRLTSIQDAAGHYRLQNVQYDSQGRVTSEQNGTGDTMSYAYTTSGGYAVTTVTVPGRGDWVYKHLQNLPMSITDPLGHTTAYTYDAMARRATVTDGRGNTTRYEYDERGNIVKQVSPQPLGYVVTRTFNATNDLLSETDGRGNTTSYAYATSSDPAADYQVGQLKTITDRESGVSTFKWWTSTSSPAPPSTNVGLLKSVTNQRSKTTSFDYDSSGNLTKITSPIGLKTTMGYDGSGRLTSLRDPRGNVPVPPAGYLTQWTYDAVDHVATLTDARNNVTSFDYTDNELLWKITKTENDSTPRVTSFDYDNANRLWKTTNPRSGIETRLYWADGQLKSVQSPEGRKTSYDYDNAGRLTSMVEPNGNATGATASDWTWTYGYDNADNRTSEAHPDGGTTQIAYDAINRPNQWTDPLTHITSVSYDANDNITTSTDGLSHSKSYTYDKLDRLKTVTDERNKTTTYAYFATGELQSITTPLGNKTTYGLDDDGRTTSRVEPRGNAQGADPTQYTWAYQYDEAGNRTRVTDPLGNPLQYSYNGVDDVTQVTDERNNTTSFTYDSMNRLWKVTPPAAGGTGTLDTVYGYDPDGNLASRTDPNNHASNWTYDLDGNPTSRTTPVGTWNLTYDSNVNVKALETPAGSSTQTAGDGTINYSYDRMSRLTGVDYSDSTPDVTRSYDNAGRLQTMVDGSGTVTYSYDNADRLTDIARTGGGGGLNGTFHYDYDNVGNITGRTYPDSTTTSEAFDDDGRLTSITSASLTTSFGYDAAGNITTVTLPSGNGYVATRTFDRAGRLTTVDNSKSGTILSKFLWTLDAAGNPTKVQTTRGATDTYDAYEYDARNRLTASCYAVSAGASNCSGASNAITYAYDKVSNRTQEVRSGNVGNTGTIDYTYNSADQLTSTTKSGQSTNYTYDANGNQATIGSRSFTHDLANRLVSTTAAGTTSSYSYDGDDHRLSSTTGGGGADLRYIWDQFAETGVTQLTLERTPTGSTVRGYLNGPLGAISFSNTSGRFYYHHDPIDTVTDVTGGTGASQWKYEYEGYGAQRTATDVSGTAPATPLRFAGEYLDADPSQYDLRAREYDPATGRFDSLDPLDGVSDIARMSAYGYVDARPTVMIDPSGMDWVPPWAKHAYSTAKGVTVGTLRFANDTQAKLHKLNNPVNLIAGFGKRVYHTGNTCRDGAVACVNAINEYWNPMFPVVAAGDQCLFQTADVATHTYGCLEAGAGLAAAGAALATGEACEAALGDLTAGEVARIQAVVDAAGRPLEVVGSAARGQRRNPGSGLPIGKGNGTRSDIDYLVPPGSRPFYDGLDSALPSIDPGSGIMIGTHNPFIGPAIRFEPGTKPKFVQGTP